MTLLDIENLTVALGRKPVLDSVSLKVGPGEIVGLVGESGSGKSMTVMSVLGLAPPRADISGNIVFDGAAIAGADEKELCKIRGRDIGMIFQEPMTALNPVVTIGEQVAETVRVHTQATHADSLKIARETLNRVGLPEAQFPLTRYPHDLSGGQRQRVAIAIALALKPKLIIADEPTTALDVTTQAEILSLLKTLVRADGAGLIFISHDLGVVAEIADRVAIMKDGAIVEQGSVHDIFQSAQHPYTAALIKDSSHVPVRSPKKDADKKPTLEVNDIIRDYPGKRKLFGRAASHRAVDGVRFDIFTNENVGLVGESGCGKSTLLRTILGLDRAQSGDVRVFGQAFPARRLRDTRNLRRLIQAVFQDPFGSFDPRWRVEQIISENFHLYDTRPGRAEARKKVEEALESVGLAPADADRFPHEFSGGQRQRIAIARALITNPSIIALDEAVSALDVTVRAKVLDLLAELSDRKGVSYLFVTHDLSVVRAITDRVLVMKSGRIVEEGATEAVFSNPQHEYTAALLRAAPNLQRTLRSKECGKQNR